MTAISRPLPPRATAPPQPLAALRRLSFTFTDDGSHAACLASAADRGGARSASAPMGAGWYVESWRLGPGVPRPVPLWTTGAAALGGENPRSPLVALPDGRVLLCRQSLLTGGVGGGGVGGGGGGGGAGDAAEVGGAGPVLRSDLVVLAPPEAAHERPDPQDRSDGAVADGPPSPPAELPYATELQAGQLLAAGVRLVALPASGAGPEPDPGRPLAVALAVDARPVTTAWLVFGDGREPQPVAEAAGLFGGGVWIDTGGRMLALDRVCDGIVKTMVLDLADGSLAPLLEIAAGSNDRVSLADPASGLVVLRSDAPGADRLGWGVLGEDVPVRFPECLHQSGALVRPVAVEPAPPGTPAAELRVALQIDRGAGSGLALWRPSSGRLERIPVPAGRFGGVGHWSPAGLRMPFSAPDRPAAVATVQVDLLRGVNAGSETAPVAIPLPLRLAPLRGVTPLTVPSPAGPADVTETDMTATGGPAPAPADPHAEPRSEPHGGPHGGPHAERHPERPVERTMPLRRITVHADWAAQQPGWRLDGSTPAPDGGRWRSAQSLQLTGAEGPLEAVVYGGEGWLTAEHLVVALHGGPADAWRLEFEPTLQRMAAEGLAVVAPNQRGSTGYGAEFANVLCGAWGGPDLDDVLVLLDGIAGQRAALGLEPPALFGVSYGAFLALLAAASAPDQVVRCAAVAPFLSGPRLFAEACPSVRALTARLGGTTELQDARGPRDVLRWCHRLVAPLLLVHGDADQVVPVGQSRALRNELLRIGRLEGTDFRYVEAAGAGHEVLAEACAPVLHELLAVFLRTGRGG